MELQPQFAKFLQEIRPTERHREDWKTGSDTLRTRLTDDAELSKIIVTSFLQGSVRRATAVRPTGDKRSDVDIVVVTTIEHNAEKPAQAMDRFKPFLEKHYKGKWSPQDRSFGIELSYVDLDLVVTALPTDPTARAALRRIYESEAVKTTASIEERADWRLSKAWSAANDTYQTLSEALMANDEMPEADWKPHPLMLPDRPIAKWGPTHPVAQIQWTATKNRLCNGHFVNVVRAIKWWRLEHANDLPKYPKGYPLEHMIGLNVPDGIKSVAEGVTAAFEGIRKAYKDHVDARVVPSLPDHGVPSHNVLKRISFDDFAAFHKSVWAASETARAALDSVDAKESGELWQSLFGKAFPLPGPGGGDRSRGFTTPAAAAVPSKTERFA